MTTTDKRITAWSLAILMLIPVLGVTYIVLYGPTLPFAVLQEIHEVTQFGDHVIEVSYGCTTGSEEHLIVPEADSVTITINARTHGGDCASGFGVELEEPLGDRAVIDGSTGERVEVQGRLVRERP